MAPGDAAALRRHNADRPAQERDPEIARGVGDAALAARLTAELAAGAGPTGMIAGQVADMGLCPLPAGAEGLRYIHLRKTAALIRAAARMGGLCAGADAARLAALGDFGERLGLAFQMADDLLDAVGQSKDLGKTAGKDAQANKRTYATQLGVERTTELAQEITREACRALDALGGRAAQLRELAQVLAQRDR